MPRKLAVAKKQLTVTTADVRVRVPHTIQNIYYQEVPAVLYRYSTAGYTTVVRMLCTYNTSTHTHTHTHTCIEVDANGIRGLDHYIITLNACPTNCHIPFCVSRTINARPEGRVANNSCSFFILFFFHPFFCRPRPPLLISHGSPMIIRTVIMYG